MMRIKLIYYFKNDVTNIKYSHSKIVWKYSSSPFRAFLHIPIIKLKCPCVPSLILTHLMSC